MKLFTAGQGQFKDNWEGAGFVLHVAATDPFPLLSDVFQALSSAVSDKQEIVGLVAQHVRFSNPFRPQVVADALEELDLLLLRCVLQPQGTSWAVPIDAIFFRLGLLDLLPDFNRGLLFGHNFWSLYVCCEAILAGLKLGWLAEPAAHTNQQSSGLDAATYARQAAIAASTLSPITAGLIVASSAVSDELGGESLCTTEAIQAASAFERDCHALVWKSVATVSYPPPKNLYPDGMV